MLLWTTQWLGCANEFYSRPVITPDRVNYNYPSFLSSLSAVNRCSTNKTIAPIHLISQIAWERDRVLRDEHGKLLDTTFDYIRAQSWSNFVRRQVPYTLGIFTFMTYVVCVVWHLEYQKYQLDEETDGQLRIPGWINALLYGTLILFSSFAFVMPIFQFLPPSFYFGTEIAYCLLSLVSKLWLGIVILVNVIMVEGRAEDLLGASGLDVSR